jgi:hypothetical protein
MPPAAREKSIGSEWRVRKEKIAFLLDAGVFGAKR